MADVSWSDILVKPNDLPGQWEWVNTKPDKETGVSGQDSAISNSLGVNYFGGYFFKENQKYYFTFYHSIRLAESENSPTYSPFTPGGFGDVFTLNLIKISQNFEMRCSKNENFNPIFMCEALTRYNDVYSFLRIVGSYELGQSSIEEMINHLLQNIDQRFLQYR